MFEYLRNTKNRYKLFPSKEFQTVALVESALLEGARSYLSKNNYIEVVVPHIVSIAGSCEIIDTLFEIPYFGKQAFLTQTGQLYLEALVPFLGGKVWTFGPSFRAEPKADNRHLTEFSLLELEFEGDFEHLLNVIEGLFKSMINNVKKLPIKADHLNLETPFKRCSYGEAIEILGLRWGQDLYSTDEQKLLESNDNQPMFITHFPKELKYFNMRENSKDPKIVNSADFLLPFGGESAGAAEREYNPVKLLARLKDSGMWHQYLSKGGNPHNFDWYINAYFEYRYNLHSGFGMGLNRITKFVLQTDDIRATTTYPMNSESLY